MKMIKPIGFKKITEDKYVGKVNIANSVNIDFEVSYSDTQENWKCKYVNHSSNPCFELETQEEGCNSITKYGFENPHDAIFYANTLYTLALDRYLKRFTKDLKNYVIL